MIHVLMIPAKQPVPAIPSNLSPRFQATCPRNSCQQRYNQGNRTSILNSEQYIQYMDEGGIYDRDYMLKNWDGLTNTAWTDVAFNHGHMQKHALLVQGYRPEHHQCSWGQRHRGI